MWQLKKYIFHFFYLSAKNKVKWNNSPHNKALIFWLWRESPYFFTWHLGGLSFLCPIENQRFHMVSTFPNNCTHHLKPGWPLCLSNPHFPTPTLLLIWSLSLQCSSLISFLCRFLPIVWTFLYQSSTRQSALPLNF